MQWKMDMRIIPNELRTLNHMYLLSSNDNKTKDFTIKHINNHQFALMKIYTKLGTNMQINDTIPNHAM